MLRRGIAFRSRLRRCDGEPDVPLRKTRLSRGGGPLGGPRVADPGGAGALVRERSRPSRAPGVHARDPIARSRPGARSDAQGSDGRAPTGNRDAGKIRFLPWPVRVFRHAPRRRSRLRGMRDSSAMPRGDAVSVPSAAEVEHADWPTLEGMCRSLGLNPKGRSGVVRMRVLEHVRRRGRPESWRAGRDHMAALLTRLGFPDLAEDLWESAIRLDAPAPWVGLGQAQVAGGFLSEAAKSFDRAAQMGDRSALLHRAEALGAGGDYDRAIAACESYLADRPGDLRALGMKADFLARSSFKEEAARVLLTAADAHPEAPFLRSAAGTSFLKAGRPEVALEAFGLPKAVDAAGIGGAINHGAALLVLGRTREAVEIFQKAIEADPDRAEALNNLGVAQLQLGQTELAASNLDRAAEVDSPRIRLNLAQVVPKTAPRPRARKPAARKKQKP